MQIGGGDVRLLATWKPTDEETVAKLTAELARDLDPGHPLFGVAVAAVALAPDSDDVLFRLLDGSGRLAVVHLTWRKGIEALPWPFTTIYDSDVDWLSRGGSEG